MFAESTTNNDDNQTTFKESLEKLKPTKHLLIVVFFTLGLIGAAIFVNLAIVRWRTHIYEFNLSQDTLIMKDGVQLSVSLAIPVQRRVNEKFSILLDYSIGRKDDFTYISDYRYFAAMASSGYAVAKVDVRGTGGSGGKLQDRISSAQELEDGLEVMHLLARKHWSTGKIVLIGMSQNTLLLAAKRPPSLKAVFVLHTPYDIYSDSLHHADGTFHATASVLNMAHQHGLPQSPNYLLDEEYYTNRFTQEPWLIKYLENQLDGAFWSTNSVEENLKNIQVPVYLVGGLYDSYVDSALHIYEHLKNYVPEVKVVMGPFNREWPSYAKPGPNFDGREEGVKWFNKWLKDRDSEITSEPDVSIFLRDSHEPDTDDNIPGTWTFMQWPLESSTSSQQQFYLSSHHKLSAQLEPLAAQNDSLVYNPTIGARSGSWWGDYTPNMQVFDEKSLTYDSETLTAPVSIVGYPSVSLKVAANFALARWNVRLEEVFPSGQVSLVTMGTMNGAFREGRTNPQSLPVNEYVTLKFDLHFTTWKFGVGNKIRIAISNSLWPTYWPTPGKMTTYLMTNDKESLVVLPVLSSSFKIDTPAFTKVPPQTFYPFVTKSLQRKDGFDYDFGRSPRNYAVCESNTTRSLIWTSDTYSNIKSNFIANFVAEHFTASIENPALSSWVAEARTLFIFALGTPEDMSGAPNVYTGDCKAHSYDWEWMPSDVDLTDKRTVDMRTQITLLSDASNFNITVTRVIKENGKVQREYIKSQIIPRQYQ